MSTPSDEAPAGWPTPCCQGAVPINRDGMAMHPYGATCGICGRDDVRCFARYDVDSRQHLCSNCDPKWLAFQAEQRARRRRHIRR